jgi:hypothetical protein
MPAPYSAPVSWFLLPGLERVSPDSCADVTQRRHASSRRPTSYPHRCQPASITGIGRTTAPMGSECRCGAYDERKSLAVAAIRLSHRELVASELPCRHTHRRRPCVRHSDSPRRGTLVCRASGRGRWCTPDLARTLTRSLRRGDDRRRPGIRISDLMGAGLLHWPYWDRAAGDS